MTDEVKTPYQITSESQLEPHMIKRKQPEIGGKYAFLYQTSLKRFAVQGYCLGCAFTVNEAQFELFEALV